MKTIGACLAMMLGTACQAAPQSALVFAVLNQGSLQPTAAYWNPVLVSSRSGVLQPLGLSGARGFVAADGRDYHDYRDFFSRTQVPLDE